MIRSVFLIIGLSLLLLSGCDRLQESDFKSTVPPIDQRTIEPTNEPEPVALDTDTTMPSIPALPKEINLDIPFYAQAPDGDWSLPWKEACEESSTTLAYYAAIGESLSKEQFKKDILGLVEWQKENLGDYLHTTVEQTAQMLEDYFGYTNYTILENPTLNQLQRELAEGHFIVAPFAGRLLGNPFYSGEGPLYHMLVIRGYDEQNFITNDVGTRRGENFIYKKEVIMNALHDYNGSNDITQGAKKVLVIQ